MSVVHLKRKNGAIVVGCDVYIGRQCHMGGWHLNSSKWANPFSVKEYGRDEALNKYRQYVMESGLINEIEELRGKILGCWCAPLPCHGDILLQLLNK